jgi:hypothetical protein
VTNNWIWNSAHFQEKEEEGAPPPKCRGCKADLPWHPTDVFEFDGEDPKWMTDKDGDVWDVGGYEAMRVNVWTCGACGVESHLWEVRD